MESEHIILRIPTEKYKFMLKTLESFKSGIRLLSINLLYKQSLIKEIHIIESILKTNRSQ